MTKTNVSGENQGEGDATADGRYREAAREFVAAGRVEAAALASREALKGPEAAELEAAEKLARKDAGPTHDHDPLPSFWTEKQATGWDRIKEALHRDWLQTKFHLGLAGGAELAQNAIDTLEQASGTTPLPNGAAVGLDWDLARHAIRLGHGSATFWVDDISWNEAVESRVRAEWSGLATGIEWEQALPLVRHGWELGRNDMITSTTATPISRP